MSWIYEKVEILQYLESFELLDSWKSKSTATPRVVRCLRYLTRQKYCSTWSHSSCWIFERGKTPADSPGSQMQCFASVC
jgi:hypothetical protein